MTAPPTIAIIDDHADSRDTYASSASRVGYAPIKFDRRYASLDDLLSQARERKVRYAICDHRLTEGHYAKNFSGAAAVARFYDAGIPAVLVTGYLPSDVETTIRPYRRKIPRLLSRVTQAILSEALQACYLEVVEREIPMERQGFRAVLTVKELLPQGPEVVVKVRVTQWKTSELAGFPFSMVPASIRRSVTVGAFLFATVNTGAASADDLFFEDFELPHPDDVKSIRSQFGNR